MTVNDMIRTIVSLWSLLLHYSAIRQRLLEGLYTFISDFGASQIKLF
jgi:hypothetical protein